MFWSITATLTLEWLMAMACRFTLHGAVHGLLVLAAMSLLLALVSHVQGNARDRKRSHSPSASRPSQLALSIHDEPAV